jgi:putative transposase
LSFHHGPDHAICHHWYRTPRDPLRGNRREQVFFSDEDYAAQSYTEVWSWCLMSNHVRLIADPSHPDGLRAMLSEVHRRHTKRINQANEWTVHI